jgi:hypothetical protein
MRHKPFAGLPQFAVLLAILFVFTLSVAKAEPGLVAWKEHSFHPDSSARIFYFENMKGSGPITWFYNGQERKGFEKHQPFDYIFIPSSLGTGPGGKENLALVKASYDQIQAFCDKYPAAGVIMRKRLDQMRTSLVNYQKGEIYYNGKWIACSEYDKIMAAEREEVSKLTSIKDPANARAVARLDSDPRKTLQQATYATSAAFLGVMLVLGLRGKFRLMLQLSLLPMVLIFGWFTYEERGIDWMKRFPEKIMEIPQKLGFPEWNGQSASATSAMGSHSRTRQTQSAQMVSQSRLNFRRSSLTSDYEPVDLTLGKRRVKSASDELLQSSAEE